MSTTLPTIKTWRRDIEPTVTEALFQAEPSNSVTTVRFAKHEGLGDVDVPNAKRGHPLAIRPQWRDREYREAYMEAAIEQGVAWQIKTNRKLRNLSQRDLAKALGTQQSAVSRMEDPEYGSHSLETLIQVAKAFDCALLVKFIPYSQLARESECLSETDQYAAPFGLDIEDCDD